MPLESLLLETDAPTCRCRVSRGRPTPRQPAKIAQLLADLRQQPLAHVASVLRESTLQAFQLGKLQINS